MLADGLLGGFRGGIAHEDELEGLLADQAAAAEDGGQAAGLTALPGSLRMRAASRTSPVSMGGGKRAQTNWVGM